MFEIGDRVRVSSQASQYRNHLGVVVAVDDTDVYVRIDGHGKTSRTLFTEGELQTSTLELVLDYTE